MRNDMASVDTIPTLQPAFDYDALPPSDAQEAREVAARIRAKMKTAMIETGQDLARMKDRLGHGKFLKWIAAEFAMTPRTAQNYIGAAALQDKYEKFSHLPASALYDLAAPSTPSHVYEMVLQRLEAGERPLHATVRDMVKKARYEQVGGRKKKQEGTLNQLSRDRGAMQADGSSATQLAADIIARSLGGKLADLLQVLGEHASIKRADLVAAAERASEEKPASERWPYPSTSPDGPA